MLCTALAAIVLQLCLHWCLIRLCPIPFLSGVGALQLVCVCVLMCGRLANVQTYPNDLCNVQGVLQPCWLVMVQGAENVVSIGRSQMGFGKLTGVRLHSLHSCDASTSQRSRPCWCALQLAFSWHMQQLTALDSVGSYLGMLSWLRGCCWSHPICAIQAKPVHFDQLLVVTAFKPGCKVHKALVSCLGRNRRNTW